MYHLPSTVYLIRFRSVCLFVCLGIFLEMQKQINKRGSTYALETACPNCSQVTSIASSDWAMRKNPGT